MTDEKRSAPPAITPQSPAPRPDLPTLQGHVAVPPPPPSSVATDDRTHQRYERAAAESPSGPGESSEGGSGSVTATLAAMRKAAKKVTSVVTGEGGLETGATPVVATPSAAAQQEPAAAQPVRQTSQPAAQPAGQQQYAYAGAAGYAAAQQPPAQPQAQAQPQPALQTTTAHAGSARRVRLVVSRVNPWSVMKMAFLLSIAVGIITVVAAAVVWTILNGMHLFANVNDLVASVVGDETKVNVLQYVAFSRTMSLATLIAVANIVLITALSTLGAFLYNIAAALVGGVHVTLTDD
ncbi:DUF3566 domain-containing protein [Luteimicrobium sp. DT211]|uniref:DUF3566 domain-containing protein n=1 Tax=Luteimicrobium sp. DT211 TaxID=3393412 RepID=UPI003CE80F16